MIVITGATGSLNGATAEHLLERLPAADLAVVARDPQAARSFTDRGVEVRHGDYADPASLPAAFAGADQLLLVSSSDPRADAVALHRTAIEAATAAGVGRILYTSHQGAAPDSPFGPGRDHFATERILADSGTPWTALRNGFYLHSIDLLLGPWRETGAIREPADGPVSWTSRADAAEGAARIMLADAPLDGPVTLTASAAPTMAEVAEQASEVAGREVRLEIVDPEDWISGLVAVGTPEPVARFLLGLPLAAAGGFFAGTDPLLAELLGREPESVRDHLARG
jgi:NAD(P)H dehydrogenase (quinone)